MENKCGYSAISNSCNSISCQHNFQKTENLENCVKCGYNLTLNGCNSISCQTCCATDKYGTKCWLKKELGRMGCRTKHRTKQKYEQAMFEEFPPRLTNDLRTQTKQYKNEVIEFNKQDDEYQQRVENKLNESRSEEEQDLIRSNPTCFVDGEETIFVTRLGKPIRPLTPPHLKMTHHFDDDDRRRLVLDRKEIDKLEDEIDNLQKSIQQLKLELQTKDNIIRDMIKLKDYEISSRDSEVIKLRHLLEAQEKAMHELESENEALSTELATEKRVRELFLHMQTRTS